MSELMRSVTLHAERLERDDVWRRTSAFLGTIEARGARATLFVHPFTAIEAGVDLGPRLEELIERGHELGQHTHYYAPRDPDGAAGKPVSLLTAENVIACLDRDFAYLRQAGVDPRGYVAGGWVIHDAALEWLRAHGFTYDASVRSFSLKYDNPPAAAGEGWTAPLEEHGLLRLPTTAPLTNIARQRGHPLPVGNLRYELGYIHDYDLSSSAHRTAARVALRRWSDGGVLITASALAQRVGERLVDG